MKYENVDKDPDLRKARDLEPTNRPWLSWVLAVGGVFIGIVLVVLAGWASIEWFGWTPGNNAEDSKAGAAAAWASAVGATALALASVWLAWRAEARAKEDMTRAEERHEKELEAAEKRLTDELEAQRKHQQLMAISPIWVELVSLAKTYSDISTVPEQFAVDRETTMKMGGVITGESLIPIQKALRQWVDATTDFDTSCSNALMMVIEPKTARLVAELYVQFRLVQKDMGVLTGKALVDDPLDVQTSRLELDKKMEDLRLRRRAVIRSARENIVGAEWLDLSIDGMDPFEVDEPISAPPTVT